MGIKSIYVKGVPLIADSSVGQSRAHPKTKQKASRKLKKQFNRIKKQIDKLPITKI